MKESRAFRSMPSRSTASPARFQPDQERLTGEFDAALASAAMSHNATQTAQR